MESSWLFVFLPYLPADCLDCKYGGGWCRKEDKGQLSAEALHRHPERAAALLGLSLFQGIRTSRCNGSFPIPLQSPCMEQLVCTALDLHGLAHLQGSQPHSASPALQLLLGDFGQVTLCLTFPSCKMERGILHFAEVLDQEYRRSVHDVVFVVHYLSTRLHHQCSVIITINIAIVLLQMESEVILLYLKTKSARV